MSVGIVVEAASAVEMLQGLEAGTRASADSGTASIGNVCLIV